MIFAWRHQAHTPAKGRVAWTFAFGEAFKVLAMLVLPVSYTHLDVYKRQFPVPLVNIDRVQRRKTVFIGAKGFHVRVQPFARAEVVLLSLIHI